MGCLVDQNAAAFALPGAAPCVAVVVGLITPAQHGDHAQHRLADLASLDGFVDAHTGAVEAALHHRADGDVVLVACLDNAVAVSEAGSQRLLDEDVAAVLRCGHSGVAVDGVRGADADDVQMFFLDHLRNVRVGVDIVSLCEGFCTLQIGVTHGSELAVLQLGVCLCMEIADLSAADDTGFQLHCSLPFLML